jgi:hypothetical protein
LPCYGAIQRRKYRREAEASSFVPADPARGETVESRGLTVINLIVGGVRIDITDAEDAALGREVAGARGRSNNIGGCGGPSKIEEARRCRLAADAAATV